MRPDPAPPTQDIQNAASQPPAARPGWTTEERRYELITPLFGGGAVPRQADEVTTVRGAEVRGQLRFWWRATRGGQYGGNLATMKAAEEVLWGAASRPHEPRPSLVDVALTIDASGSPLAPNHAAVPRYAAFPLLEGNQGAAPPHLVKGIKFTLTLRFPTGWPSRTPAGCFTDSPKEEVEAALWAWETFGGLGGRTRRGFGALHCIGKKIDGTSVPVEQPATLQQAIAWLNGCLAHHIPLGAWPLGVPYLGRTPAFNLKLFPTGPGQDPALVAWNGLIARLKDFRQARPGPANNPGRSVWPEPDTIRRLTGRWSRPPGHDHTPVHAVRKFPRAAFGWPIVFRFKAPDEATGDPHRATLQGSDRKRDRLASPLILRPVCCANGQAVGLAIVLEGCRQLPPDLRLTLVGAPAGTPIDMTVTGPEAASIPPLGGQTDVLRHFLETL